MHTDQPQSFKGGQMKLIGILLITFSGLFGLANINRAIELHLLYDLLFVVWLVGGMFLTIGAYRDIVTSQHSKEN
jgi:hypothetical protein